MAWPDTSLSSSVSSAPHVTYTIDSVTNLVTQATDEMGRVRAKTYNGNLDTVSSTVGSGASSTTTTNTYGANNGMSRTKSVAQMGATSTSAFANTGASSVYSPSFFFYDSGNT